MASPISIAKPHLLVVEGPEDQRFWRSLFDSSGRGHIQIFETGGKDNLRRFLPALVRSTGFANVSWLGIVQDADNDPAARFQSVRGALVHAGLAEPDQPWAPTDGNPTTTAFILPDGSSPGDLESLLWLGLAETAVAPCVEQYLECLSDAGVTPVRRSKAQVYAYLASLPNPDLRLSHAMLQGRVTSPQLDALLSLLP